MEQNEADYEDLIACQTCCLVAAILMETEQNRHLILADCFSAQ